MSSKLLALARLLRLPNLFTAAADPLAGWFIAGGTMQADLILIVGIALCLYSAGMVLNDCVDYAADSRLRPERPLPQGVIHRTTAWTLGILLVLAGLLGAFIVGRSTLVVALVITIAMLVYNFGLKATPLGPLALGVCRAFNLLLGMSLEPAAVWWPAAVLGVYVAGLSFVARREELRPELRSLVKKLLLGIITVDAVLVVATTGDWAAGLLVLSLLVPAIALGKLFAMT